MNQTPTFARPAKGFILIAALALLLMLTLLSVGMFRSLGLEERIAGNTREKADAFYAAQSALQNAEAWLSAGNAGAGTGCSLVSATPTPQICNVATTPTQQTLATTLWNATYGTTFVPPVVTINGVPQQQMSASQYYADPQYEITYLGSDPANANSKLYQITAQGFGGTQNSVAVVQSVYSVGVGTSCASCAY
jgi:type IV pilus assembly protein PilX